MIQTGAFVKLLSPYHVMPEEHTQCRIHLCIEHPITYPP